jgi:predicted 2-oxoglutarate/Fe(II)-dependent dioxygenase YbiX
MNIKDYIFVSKIFNSQECDDIVNKTNQYTWRKHRWNSSSTKGKSVEEIDDILVCNIDPILESKITPNLLSVFGKYSILHSPQNVPIQLINQWDTIRINKYTKDVGMRYHIDHGIDREHPVLTIIVLLNDEFTGGNTLVLNEEVSLKKGDCVIFPSNFMYPHEIKPVTDGTRYSLTTWAY